MSHFRGFPRRIALEVLAFILLWVSQAEARASPKGARTAFLQSQLPLRLIVTTPMELAGNTGLTPVSGRQALTAVFSRPVIALGSDFGQPGAPPKFPFSLSCGVPGKSRWVTTTIARFDPDVDWPTDLDCELSWATNTTTYDGAVLSLGDTAPKRRLSTSTLSMWLDDVTSAQASNLTDSAWGAYADGQWEVPPDGKILLSFDHPVNLQLLRSALKMVEADQAAGHSVAFEVGPCQSAAPWTFYTTGHGTASSSSSSSSTAPAPGLDINTTCAEVSPTSALKPATTYLLLLGRGARYHALAGPLQGDLNVTVTGLRPFRLPFSSNDYQTDGSGSRYRRLDLWLPHGLSNDTTPEALASRISLCEVAAGPPRCTVTPFALSMVSRARARLNVSTLQPLRQYRISVAADPRVKDGFEQGLQASGMTFWAGAPGYVFAPPRSDGSVAVLEPGTDSLTSWPFVTRGVGPIAYWGDVTGSIRAWEVDLSDGRVQARVARALPQYGFINNIDLTALFGKPTESLAVPPELLSTANDAPDWVRLELPLRGPSKPSRARIVSHANTQGNTQYIKLIVNTSLSLSVVQSGQRLTAWVLDSAPGGGPLAGAVVTVFQRPMWVGSKEEASLLAKCVTDSDGVCTMTDSEADYWSLSAFVVAGTQFAVLDSAGFARGPTQPPAYVASLVADRLVVIPGDTIKVTGFVQRVTPDGLQLPAATFGALQVQPEWQLVAAAASGAGAGAGVATSGGKPAATRGLLQSQSATAAASVAVDEGPVQIAGDAWESMATIVMGSRENPASSGAKATSATAPSAFAVKVSGTTGTFHAEITVPKGVRLQPYTIVLAIPPPGTPEADPRRPVPAPGDPVLLSWDAIPTASLTIVVADPRPPTADLKLVAPPWALPNATVTFTVTAVSYIGASVGGAPLTATWRTPKAYGVLALTTDAAGVATGSVQLGQLPPANVSEPYDGDLSIDVEWIGPTRERITRSTRVILADGPARLQLQLSLTPSTPGTAFALAATLTSNAGGGPLLGLPVTATLRPAPPDAAHPGTPTCDNRASCVAFSGEPFSPFCQLALPCVGRFLLEACADVPSGPVPSLMSAASHEAEAEAEGPQRVCVSQALGRNPPEWAEAPLRAHELPELFTDKPSYKLGDVVRLRFQNSWPGARLLLHWGNEFRSRLTVIPSVGAGLAEVSVGPLGDEALGGATLLAVVDVPRLPPPPPPPAAAAAAAAAGQPPKSPLFDPLAPHSFYMRTALDVRPDNALTMSVDVAAAAVGNGNGNGTAWTIRDVSGADVLAVEPGATAQVTVSVSNRPAAAAGAGVEVTVYGIDKAFLDLLPYDLPHPELQMVLQLAAEASAYTSAAYRLAPGAVRTVYDKLMYRLTRLDPWLPLDTGVQPAEGSAVDVNDTTYLERYGTLITEIPTRTWYGRRYFPEFAMDATGTTAVAMTGAAMSKAESGAATASSASTASDAADSDSGSRGGGSGGVVSVRLSSDFVVTPLFATATTDASGRARVNFTAPQNLGTFVIRAFAALGSSARYGSAEGSVAVRRRLSLTPSLPRFVRVGDNFSAGVIVTVGSAPATVAVTVKLSTTASASATPLTLAGSASLTVTFRAGGGLQQEVRFSFSAGAIGSSNLTFTAQDSQPGGAADALQSELQVVGQQGEVWVATSFALAAMPPSINGSGGGGLKWQEGMELPAAVPGSGGLNLTAGVGYLPAISAIYDTLMQTDADRLYASAVPAMMWVALPAVLSYYGQPISTARAERAKGGFTDLAKLTRPDLGLLWSDPDRWYGWGPTRTDLGLNTWALFLAAQLGPALLRRDLAPSLAPLAASWASLESGQVPSWRAAVARQLVDDAIESRRRPYSPGPYSDWDTLAWVRLVLGGGWAPSDASKEIRDDLSLATLLANNQSMSRQTRVLTSLVVQSMGRSNPAPRLVTSTIDDVTSALRVQGRTAYVAASSGAAAPSSLEVQALSLLLLLRAGVTHQLLPKLAAYVANPPPVGGYGIFYVGCSPREQAVAVAALSEYDRVRGSSKPNVELAADVNGVALMVASFKSGGTPQPVSTVAPWEDIPPPPHDGVSKLNFQAVGSGEVTVAASLRFVPAQLLPFPSYRGLFVESALQLADPATGGPTGQRLAAVPLGSVVVLSVQLTSPDDLGPVTLSVLMPAGLEPLDPNLDGGGGAGLRLRCDAGWVDGSSWSSFFRWWWWPVCPSQETRPSLVTFSYLALRAGTSSVSLRAVAATPGSFVFPPIRASADDQPELAGATAAATLTVCADCSAPRFAEPLPLPIACQNDCSGNGVCNLRTGRCRCDAGYGRADCSRPSL